MQNHFMEKWTDDMWSENVFLQIENTQHAKQAKLIVKKPKKKPSQPSQEVNQLTAQKDLYIIFGLSSFPSEVTYLSNLKRNHQCNVKRLATTKPTLTLVTFPTWGHWWFSTVQCSRCSTQGQFPTSTSTSEWQKTAFQRPCLDKLALCSHLAKAQTACCSVLLLQPTSSDPVKYVIHSDTRPERCRSVEGWAPGGQRHTLRVKWNPVNLLALDCVCGCVFVHDWETGTGRRICCRAPVINASSVSGPHDVNPFHETLTQTHVLHMSTKSQRSEVRLISTSTMADGLILLFYSV